MSRILAALFVLWLAAPVVQAQGFSALARADAERSRIGDNPGAGTRIDLHLSLGVPYRIFTLDGPPRLVVDFQEVDWTGFDPARMGQSGGIRQVQVGAYVPGWSRLVAELAGPMTVAAAEMALKEGTRAAWLRIDLTPATAETFAAAAGAPHDPRWDLPAPAQVVPRPPRGPEAPLVVVIDPGHGGIDPGAETEHLDEKDLMLTFARELRELMLRRGGFDVVLTRDGDHFVSLERRIAIAHEAGADLFMSLHADSLSEGRARGATVHVLSREASDAASAKLAERHDRGQLLSGLDLSETDDEVTGVLLDLARQETRPRTRALARALAEHMEAAGGPMNRRPLRSASFSVLKAADIPSVLIELGFLSSPRDLENLRNEGWRAGMARGILSGIEAWAEGDRARRPLVRK